MPKKDNFASRGINLKREKMMRKTALMCPTGVLTYCSGSPNLSKETPETLKSYKRLVISVLKIYD